jgi:hypothetical protein
VIGGRVEVVLSKFPGGVSAGGMMKTGLNIKDFNKEQPQVVAESLRQRTVFSPYKSSTLASLPPERVGNLHGQDAREYGHAPLYSRSRPPALRRVPLGKRISVAGSVAHWHVMPKNHGTHLRQDTIRPQRRQRLLQPFFSYSSAVPYYEHRS